VHPREGDSDRARSSGRLLLTAFAVVTGMAPLVVLPGLYDFANLPQSAFLQSSAAGLLVAALATPVWRLRGPRPEWPPLAAPLALCLLWSGLSGAWAYNPGLSLRLWMHWLAAAVAYALLFHLADRGDDLRPVMAAALAAGGAMALLGIGQRLAGWTFVPQAFPPAATFANKNVAAEFAVGVLPFALVWAAGGRRRRPVVLAAVAAASLLAFLALSRSRAAAAAVVVQSLVLLAWWGRRRRGAWAAAAGAVLVVAVALQHTWSTAASASLSSVRGRIAIWRNTVVMIQEHALTGVGLANHPLAYPAYHRRAAADPLFSPRQHLDFAHDDYLQLSAELGLIGVALLTALAVAAVRLVRAARLCGRGAEDSALVAAATAAGAGLLTDALVSFPAYRALPPWLLALDAAVLAVIARGPAARRGFLIASSVPRRAIAGAAAITAVVLIAVASRWLRADRHLYLAQRAESRDDWPAVGRHAGLAVALDPSRKEAWFAQGTAALLGNRPGDAVRALEGAVARAPYDPNALANLGIARAAAGDARGAADALGRALRISPGEGDIGYQLGVQRQKAGDGAGALEAFRQAAAANPSDPRPQVRRGLLALRARNLAEAEQALRTALDLDPRQATAHKALGVLLLESSRPEEGAAHFRDALRLDPSIADREQMERVIAEARLGR
jgi:Flp pilus assembly protein TadD